VLQTVAAASQAPGEVDIVQFSDAGKRLNKVRVPKVVKTEAEWRQQLAPGVFDITRRADTEMAFTGKYWKLHDKGIYRCICCDMPCSARTRSLNPEPAGPASGRPSPTKTCARFATRRLVWFALRWLAPSAMPIWATYSTTVRNPPTCAIA